MSDYTFSEVVGMLSPQELALQAAGHQEIGRLRPPDSGMQAALDEINRATYDRLRGRSVKCHLKSRDGWTRTQIIPRPTDSVYVHDQGHIPPGTRLQNEYAPTMIRREFRLVKSATFRDHRTGTEKVVHWYEEV